MQRHYSTAQQEEMRAAVGKVISIATAAARAKSRQEAPVNVPLNTAAASGVLRGVKVPGQRL
jgi:hypothetical protein